MYVALSAVWGWLGIRYSVERSCYKLDILMFTYFHLEQGRFHTSTLWGLGNVSSRCTCPGLLENKMVRLWWNIIFKPLALVLNDQEAIRHLFISVCLAHSCWECYCARGSLCTLAGESSKATQILLTYALKVWATCIEELPLKTWSSFWRIDGREWSREAEID